MYTPIQSIALASALFTTACAGNSPLPWQNPAQGKKVGILEHAESTRGDPRDDAKTPLVLTVAHMQRTLGGAAWREAGVRHVLSRQRAAWDGGEPDARQHARQDASGSKPVSGADTQAHGTRKPGDPRTSAPPIRSAQDESSGAWRRYCNAGEGMSDADYEQILAGEIPDSLREGCQPPK